MTEVSVSIAPSPDLTVKPGLPTSFVDVAYTRLIPDNPGGDLSDLPSEVLDTVRIALDGSLTAAFTLADPKPASPVEARFLAGNGSVRLLKRLAVPSTGALTISLSREEVDTLSAPAAQPAPVLTMDRRAYFVPVGSGPVGFGRCKLAVAPVSLGSGGWSALGLADLFHSAKPISTSVQWADSGWSVNQVAWTEVPLGINGRFGFTLPQKSGDAPVDAWMWWLSGPQSALGIQLDDLAQARVVPIGVPLPPLAVPRDSEAVRLPLPTSEAEITANPDVYTEDPGEFCKPFKNPERVLGERSFFVTLRVEQPLIGADASVNTKPLPVLTFEPVAATLGSTAANPPSTVTPAPASPTAPVTPSVHLSPAAPTVTPTLGTAVDPTRVHLGTIVSNTNAIKFVREAIPSSYLEMLRRSDRARSPVSAHSPIQWEGDISRYQATTPVRGHILEYRMRWRSNGYSLGTVAKTLTLAPRQTRRIQKISWQRRDAASRQETTQLSDQVSDAVTRQRSYDDAVKANLFEWEQGASSSSTEAAAGGFGFATAGFVIGGGGGGSHASSSSSQGGGRKTSAAEEQQLRDAIRRYGDSLRRFQSTVISEVTQDEQVTGTTEIVRNQNFGHALTVIYYQILRHLKIETALAGVRECLFVPLAITPFTVARTYRWRDLIRLGITEPAHRDALQYLKDVLTGFAHSDVPAGRRSDQPVRYLYGSLYLKLAVERPADRDDGSFDAPNWAVLRAFLAQPALAIYTQLKGMEEAARDAAFQSQHAPTIAASWVDTLTLWAGSVRLDADFTLATRYAFNATVRVDFTAPVSQAVTRETLASLRLAATRDLPPGSVANAGSLSFTYETDQFRRSVSVSQGAADLVTVETGVHDAGATFLALPDPWERRDVRQEMTTAVYGLVEYLNEHVEYFHKLIWWNMDRDRLFMLMDGVYVPGSGDLSVASVIERDPIAIIGNSLVFRVSAGAFLGIGDITTPAQLLNHYRGETPPAEPMLVALPTDGVYAQSMMDQCTALEEHFGSTDWALNDPDPELGTIDPALLASRQSATPPPTAPTPLPQTIINLENAAAAPGPAGLANALNAVQNANAFRDMAGLAGTQANAAQAFQTAAALASSFGAQAAALKLADMAGKAHATQTADQKLATVQNAVNKGLVGAQLAQDHASAILGELHAPSSSSGPLQDSAISEAVRAAAGRPGSSISSSTPAGDVSVQLAALTPPDQAPGPMAGAVVAANAATRRVDGIDLHFPNSIPTWTKLRDANIGFVIFRCSEQQSGGTLQVDDVAHVIKPGGKTTPQPPDHAFPNRWQAAGDSNFIRGAYHFYRYNVGTAKATTGEDQAAAVAGIVQRLVPGDLAPSLDLESKYLVAALAATKPAAEALRTDLELFLDGIETRLGRTPWIYTSYFPYQAALATRPDYDPARFDHFADYPLWLKAYPYVNVDTAFQHRFDIDPTDIPPSKPSYPRNWVPAPWNTDWRILQYFGNGRPSERSSAGFDPNTDWDVTRDGIHALRGLADLGHTAPHVFGNITFVAFTDENGFLYLRRQDQGWQDETPPPPGPPAKGDVAAVGTADQQLLLYRSRVDGHVIALSRTFSSPAQWQVTDLSDTTKGAGAAPAALDDPYVTQADGAFHAVHWDADDHQTHLLTDTAGKWQADALSAGSSSRPTASGSAVLYVDGGVTHVVARAGSDGHLVDYHRDGPSGAVQADDLTATCHDAAGQASPAVTYRPTVYVPAAGDVRIVCRGLRGELWELAPAAKKATNLTQAAGGWPPSAGSPSAVLAGGARHILFRTRFGRIIDLFDAGGGTFKFQVVPCDVQAAADPSAYLDAANAALTFRAVDGTIRRAVLQDGGWSCEDTTPPVGTNTPGGGGNFI
jgi:GH25 family lysozyme M1 (1,4-beta-N-acetylmuramidase)